MRVEQLKIKCRWLYCGNGHDTHLYSVSGGTGSPDVVHAAETAAPV